MRIFGIQHTHRHIHKWTSLRPCFVKCAKSSATWMLLVVAMWQIQQVPFFFLLYPHTLLLPTFIMPNGPFSAPAASKCFGFCFQSQLVASAIALLIPTQHLLWWKRGQCSLTAASGTKPFPRVCCGGFGGRASALLLGSRPTGLPSRADRQYLQNAVEERHYPQRYYGIDIL